MESLRLIKIQNMHNLFFIDLLNMANEFIEVYSVHVYRLRIVISQEKYAS